MFIIILFQFNTTFFFNESKSEWKVPTMKSEEFSSQKWPWMICFRVENLREFSIKEFEPILREMGTAMGN